MKPTRNFQSAVDAAGVATLTLNRPETLNSLTFEIYRELAETFRSLQGDDGVKALVLTGTGRGFCSGGNVHEIIGKLVESTEEEILAFARLTGDTVLAMRQLRKPIIAAVNGIAVGGGAALALAADIRIASPEAKIGFVFPRVGLSAADMGVPWLLPRVIGLGRAAELLFTGDIIDASTAERWGLYNRVVPDAQLMTTATELAARLAQGPTVGHGFTKEMLDRESPMDFPTALEAEAQAQAVCMGTDDFREAYRAFVEKRLPRFRGK